MKNPIAAIAVGALAAASLATAGLNTDKSFGVRFYGLAEQFEWKESVNGYNDVKESGPLYGAGG